ncbi:uncharacterized protein LOC114525568 [Dendronephthya gigantea]|uniref:uncharacterized protein LOC114525568 n=1 Tax=Dendronephthya gigantea TaxID=151771 RepID=UPI00106CC66B|nr:uncharacterized protein LOC114525568 [Dendronephthya gigantea]
MAGKFLQIWSLRSVSKTMAFLIIVALAVAIYATRGMPENFEESEEWKFWRNLDFSVCVVSLAFASVLLYGSITEFRMFILSWMIWNVVLLIFWNVFLILKHNELVEWERTFRIVAIALIAFAEIPVFKYFRFLGIKDEDPKSGNTWLETQSDKVYKSLSENSSFSSADSRFAGVKASGKMNQGFQSDSPRSSVISVASEETERKSEEDKVEKEEEIAVKNGKVVNEGENEDGQSQSSFEISVTVHTPNASVETANATVDLCRSNVSGPVIENSDASEVEDVRTSSEMNLGSPVSVQDEATSGRLELENMQTTSFIDENHGTENVNANEVEKHMQTNSEVVVEVEVEENATRSGNLGESVAVEIDVTDMHM